MRHRSWHWIWLLLSPALLAGCAGYTVPTTLDGLTREQLLAAMGPPETERRTDAGSRLEFPRGPYGRQTWFVYLDATGRVARAEPALTEANFSRIVPGMTQEEVRGLLGRPGEVQSLARARGTVWSYRYPNHLCLWFQVEISAQAQVRSAGYGYPPECESRSDRADH